MVKTVELGSLGSICVGGTPSRSHPEYFDGDIPWVTSTALGPLAIGGGDATQLLSDVGVRNSSTKRIPVGSLLIGIRVGVGKSSIVNDEICINQDILALTNIDDEAVFLPYLKFAIDSHSNWFAENKRGATIKGVTSKEVAKLTIPLPAVCRQKSVVRNLLTLDAVQCLLRSELGAFEQLVQSRFIEMFGDPARPPFQYDRKPIRDIADISSGATPSREKAEYYGGNIPWVKTREVAIGDIWTTEERLTQAGLKNSSCHIVPAGSLLIAMYGQGGTRGKVAMLRIDAATNQACAAMELHSGIDGVFLLRQLDLCYEDLRSMSLGGNQKNLSLKLLKEYRLMVPPLPLQQQFAAFVAEADKSKFAVQQEIEKLEILKQSLMQKYFA